MGRLAGGISRNNGSTAEPRFFERRELEIVLSEVEYHIWRRRQKGVEARLISDYRK